jgi:SAM-dependent methyltransferase
MLTALKSVIKKFPGIKRVVEGRDRFIQLYQEEVIHSNQLSDEIENLQQTKVHQAEEIEKYKEQQRERENQIEQLKNSLSQKEKQLKQLNNKKRSDELSSAKFWDNYYLSGGNSGTGSYNRLADFKAKIVNDFILKKHVNTVAEIGCGDGNQLSLIHYQNYVGVDVSKAIIEKDKERFKDYPNYRFFHSLTEREQYIGYLFDMTISMDVIFHLLEQNVFSAYMNDLFSLSTKYVIIYSSNHEEYTQWPEYRHRNFTGYVARNFPNWKLVQYIPNQYPYVIGEEENTSASDFYIYQKVPDTV